MKSLAGVLSFLLCIGLADGGPLELGEPRKISGGSFKITSFSAPALADFNGDGLIDLALGGGGQAGIYFNRGTAKEPRFPDLDVSFPSTDGSLRALDFNRDGLMDLMLRDRVFFNFGTKTQPAFDSDWQKAQHMVELRYGELPEGYTFHYRADLCDLNGDGREDLILAVFKTKPLVVDYSGRLAVALDEGKGREGLFGTPRWISSLTTNEGKQVEFTDHGPCPAFRDLDGDGRAEAFLGNYGGGVHALVPKGELTWVKPDESIWKPKQQFSFFDFGDLNGDGLPDLVVGGFYGFVHIAWNKGTKSACVFGKPELLLGGDFRLNGHGMFDLADFDGDGVPDLLIGQGLTYQHIGGVQVFKSVGTKQSPSFLLDQSVKADEELVFAVDGHLHSAPQLTDVDGDGDKDLLVCAAPPGDPKARVYVFFNRGGLPPKLFAQAPMENEPFVLRTDDGKPIEVERGYNARWVDLDGDGMNDLVTGGSIVRWFRNIGRPRHPILEMGVPLQTVDGGGITGFIAVGDLDDDKLPDLVTGNTRGGALKFFRNSVTKQRVQFAMSEEILASDQKLNYIEGVFPLICDFNSDGRADLVLGLLKSNLLFWLAPKSETGETAR